MNQKKSLDGKMKYLKGNVSPIKKRINERCLL